jgi:hypothetical protein
VKTCTTSATIVNDPAGAGCVWSVRAVPPWREHAAVTATATTIAGILEARRHERDNNCIEDLGVERGQSTTHDGRSRT